MAEFKRMKYGFFVHYVWGGEAYSVTVNKDGSKPAGLDDLASKFDAEGFARDLSSMNVEYVMFTAWHANMNLLYPSKAMDKWVPGHSAKRDLIGDMINACKARGIKVMLYTHPRDGHDMKEPDQARTGWADGKGANPDWAKFNKDKWNDFINDIYGELVERYGNDIVGLYLDEGSGAADSYKVVDYPRLKQTIKGKHPNLLMMQNDYGNLYSCDIGNKEVYYNNGFDTADGNRWPSFKIPISVVVGSIFWAAFPEGKNEPAQKSSNVGFKKWIPYTPEAMFRYTVLQAGSCTDGGGVLWAAGPYPGGGWESGVLKRMQDTGALVKKLETSIKQTYPSNSFVTAPGTMISGLNWGVATRSADDKYEYLHVLKAPSDGSRTLQLPKPADGKIFVKASLLPDGKDVSFRQDETGISLVLPEDVAWDTVDTVIRLEMDPEILKRLAAEAVSRLKKNLSTLACKSEKSGVPEIRNLIAQAKSILDGKETSLPEYQALNRSMESIIDDLDQPELPPADRNLAGNKPVEVSSSHPSTIKQILTEGHRNDPVFWSSDDSQTSVDHNEWVRVDLGKIIKINRVFIVPRLQGGGNGDGMPLDILIKVSNDGTSWETVLERKDIPHPSGKTRGFAFGAKSARYVMVEGIRLRAMPSDGNQYRMQMQGLEIYGP